MIKRCLFCSVVGECLYTPMTGEGVPQAVDIDGFCTDGGARGCPKYLEGADTNEKTFLVKVATVVQVRAPSEQVAVEHAKQALRNEGFTGLELLEVVNND